MSQTKQVSLDNVSVFRSDVKKKVTDNFASRLPAILNRTQNVC